MAIIEELDSHEAAPEALKKLYKCYQKLSPDQVLGDPNVIDLRQIQEGREDCRVQVTGSISISQILDACKNSEFDSDFLSDGPLPCSPDCDAVNIFAVQGFQGLQIIPGLVPSNVQWQMLSSLMHICLADERNQTNVHAHYSLPYHACRKWLGSNAYYETPSFFNSPPTSKATFLSPTHKSFFVSSFLSSKLRWMTVGAQYDWTLKKYANKESPPFPHRLGWFIQSLFPGVKPEAGIMNIYRPGDRLGVHRDVSEECDNGLVSLSLGCDGIFLVGLQHNDESDSTGQVIRLRSGDVVHLNGPSRFAWHALPQVIPDTCPLWLQGWPAACSSQQGDGGAFDEWRGWMKDRRINLSVRQVKA